MQAANQSEDHFCLASQLSHWLKGKKQVDTLHASPKPTYNFTLWDCTFLSKAYQLICGEKAHLQRQTPSAGKESKADKVPVLLMCQCHRQCGVMYSGHWVDESSPMSNVWGKCRRNGWWPSPMTPLLVAFTWSSPFLLPICFINHFQIYLMNSQQRTRQKKLEKCTL